MSRSVMFAGMLALGFGAGCNKSPGDSDTLPSLRGCFSDDQCEAAEKCIFRLCNPGCDADGSCDGDRLCVEAHGGRACIRVEDNACVDASDCPLGSDCTRGRCTNLCSPDAGMLCQPDDRPDASAGSGGAGGRAAAGGSGGSTSSCPAGTLQCRDNVVTRCNASGRAVAQETCPFVCRAGACAGSCRPGELRCTGRMRERCSDGGAWTALETCQNMCTPGACTATCMDGARVCDGNAVTTCRAGRQFQIQECEYMCRAGACTGECTPGARECRSNDVATCNADGAWEVTAECSNACLNAACTGECMPGTQRCGSDTSYQICNNRGQWIGNVECVAAACVDGECTGVCPPGATRCDSETALAMCGANGQWSAPMECPGQACNDGACGGSCVPSSRRCLPNDALQPQLCSEDGGWENQPRCTEGQTCVDGACNGECIPSARRCDPADAANYQVCNDASEWADSAPCGDAMRCTGAGVCETMLNCPPGEAPEWYGMNDGVNRGLYDPRWGGPSDSFESGSELAQAGYAIVYDRAADELVVTVRVEGDDEPTADDFVYFAITSGNGGRGRAARIALAVSNMGMGMGSDPRTISSVAGYQLAGGVWSEAARPAWIEHASAWVSNPDVAWAVSFRVDLAAAGIDAASPMRLAIGAHVAGEASEDNWTTPTQLPLANPLMTQTSFWPTLNLAELGCAARVVVR